MQTISFNVDKPSEVRFLTKLLERFKSVHDLVVHPAEEKERLEMEADVAAYREAKARPQEFMSLKEFQQELRDARKIK